MCAQRERKKSDKKTSVANVHVRNIESGTKTRQEPWRVLDFSVYNERAPVTIGDRKHVPRETSHTSCQTVTMTRTAHQAEWAKPLPKITVTNENGLDEKQEGQHYPTCR